MPETMSTIIRCLRQLHNVKTKLIKSSAQQKERFFKLKLKPL